MHPDVRSIELYFPIEGLRVNSRDLLNRDFDFGSDYFRLVVSIIKWWSETDQPMEIQTSGSTGHPKTLRFNRQQVKESALLTITALNLTSEKRAMLAIDPKFIGGRMMIIRALVAGMDLICIPPVANPLTIDLTEAVHFGSFVPYQVANIFSDSNSLNRFKKIDQVLIGGAPVGEGLWNKIQELPNQIFISYGMTETLSHVALRKNKVDQDYYHALPDILFDVDDRGCLNIYAPHIQHEKIQTNDVVELLGRSGFRWIGRADNIINSGGIKINPEQVEESLRIAFERIGIKQEFIVSGIPDSDLGSKLILIIAAGPADRSDFEIKIRESFEFIPDRYSRPRAVLFVEQMVRNAGGKIDRAATLKLSILDSSD
jgi:O-succinylbenzoic acid--CoA ligase